MSECSQVKPRVQNFDVCTFLAFYKSSQVADGKTADAEIEKMCFQFVCPNEQVKPTLQGKVKPNSASQKVMPMGKKKLAEQKKKTNKRSNTINSDVSIYQNKSQSKRTADSGNDNHHYFT